MNSEYNRFMKLAMFEIKRDFPDATPQERLKMVADRWKILQHNKSVKVVDAFTKALRNINSIDFTLDE